jgi:hypothetical protein
VDDINLTPADIRADERRVLTPFVTALFATILVALVVKAVWLSSTDFWMRTLRLPISLGVTEAYLLTNAGPIYRNSPEGQEILGILFPGYPAILAQLAPKLREQNEFAVVSVGLNDGRRVRLNIPRYLPFELAAAATPDILILGTSHTREGLRPDVLAHELGMHRVINASISGGSMRAIEMLLRRFVNDAKGQRFRLLIIEVAPVSLSRDDEVVVTWQRILAALDESRTNIGKVKAKLRKALDYFPRLEGNSARPFEHWQDCNDAAEKVRGLAVPAAGLPLRFPNGIDPREVDAFRRLVALARTAAEKLVFVEIPVTDRYQASLKGYPFEHVATSVLGAAAWVRRPFSAWNISTDDFFAAKNRKPCGLDEHHLNERGAIRFSESLANIIKRQPISNQ